MGQECDLDCGCGKFHIIMMNTEMKFPADVMLYFWQWRKKNPLTLRMLLEHLESFGYFPCIITPT